jgi:hypothetical protein
MSSSSTRFGASRGAASALAEFVDHQSGLRIELHRPGRDGGRWQEYLDGAEARYRQHGILSVLQRDELEDGATVSLFFVAVDAADRVVGGLRCHGPLATVASAAAVRELAASPQLPVLRRQIEDRLGAGLVEIKGGWTDRDAPPGLSDTLARGHVHAMDWFGAGYAMCTCATRTAPRWETTGGRRIPGVDPVPYPDARYQTVALWWNRDDLVHLAEPEQWERIVEEGEQLGADRRVPAQGRAS